MIIKCKLNELERGQKGVVKQIQSTGGIRRRLLDLGIIQGTIIECLYKSPYEDPTAYAIRGTVIALRSDDSSLVQLEREVPETKVIGGTNVSKI